MTKINLHDIVDAIQKNSDLGESLLDLKTGQIFLIPEELMAQIEEGEDHYPEFEEEEIRIAQGYLDNPGDYLLLPKPEDIIDEEEIMKYFIESLDKKVAHHLLVSLKDQQAFRRFSDKLRFLGLDGSWGRLRDERYRSFLLKWCQENALIFEQRELDTLRIEAMK